MEIDRLCDRYIFVPVWHGGVVERSRLCSDRMVGLWHVERRSVFNLEVSILF